MSSPKIASKTPIALDVKAGKYFWCSCGESSNQPYCDGSHKGTEFTPVIEEIAEDKKVFWCGCKHSNKAPFCDGSHKTL